MKDERTARMKCRYEEVLTFRPGGRVYSTWLICISLSLFFSPFFAYFFFLLCCLMGVCWAVRLDVRRFEPR
ncbi:hypothetical protein QR685DRAFT_529209 [Neurospora intermedia]|uniref:Uncharacterized protein n=1 Tax=Neurospora intermedia TaxID=5142 RepID=A0ABR3D8B9_NEUIN